MRDTKNKWGKKEDHLIRLVRCFVNQTLYEHRSYACTLVVSSRRLAYTPSTYVYYSLYTIHGCNQTLSRCYSNISDKVLRYSLLAIPWKACHFLRSIVDMELLRDKTRDMMCISSPNKSGNVIKDLIHLDKLGDSQERDNNGIRQDASGYTKKN